MTTKKQTFEGVNLHYAQQCVDMTSRRVIFACGGLDTCSVSVQTHGTWATAVITLKKSNDMNGPWNALTGVNTLTTAAPIVDQFAVGYEYIMAEITTAEGSDVFASITFNGKGS